MQEEIIKGQVAKAEKGQYPGRALYGYMHDQATRTIVEHPKKGKAVRLMFRLYVTGEYSVASLRKAIEAQTGEKISKGHLHDMLKCRFYLGEFVWRGIEYTGKYPHLVDATTFARVQEIVTGRNGNRSKSRKHSFAFAHLLTCTHDGCQITASLIKGRYPYYHCTFGKPFDAIVKRSKNEEWRLNRFRKLLVSFEKTEACYVALLFLAAALICWRQTVPIYG